MNHQRIYSLDAMRGVAAFMVVLFHLGNMMGVRLLPHAYLAVDFFFMLSGFVLARAYERKLQSALSGWRFIEARLIRLYPLFALGITLGAVRAAWQIATHSAFAFNPLGAAITFLMSALMLPALNSATLLFPFNVPAWSLFFEIIINIAFALAFHRMGSRPLALFCAVMGALLFWMILGYGHADLGAIWSTATPGLLRVGFSFPLGVLMARLHTSTNRRWMVSLPAVAALAIILAIPWSVPFGRIYDATAIFLLLPALLWLGARSEVPKILEPAGAMLGDISYPLYALHFPLLQAFVHIFVQRLHLSAFLASVFCIVAVILLSWVSVHRFDAPVRRWLSGRARLRAAAMPVGP